MDGAGSEFIRLPRCDRRRGREDLSGKSVAVNKWCFDRPIAMHSEVEVVLRTGIFTHEGRADVFCTLQLRWTSTRDEEKEAEGSVVREAYLNPLASLSLPYFYNHVLQLAVSRELEYFKSFLRPRYGHF